MFPINSPVQAGYRHTGALARREERVGRGSWHEKPRWNPAMPPLLELFERVAVVVEQCKICQPLCILCFQTLGDGTVMRFQLL